MHPRHTIPFACPAIQAIQKRRPKFHRTKTPPPPQRLEHFLADLSALSILLRTLLKRLAQRHASGRAVSLLQMIIMRHTESIV
jgi:hypothetical protein